MWRLSSPSVLVCLAALGLGVGACADRQPPEELIDEEPANAATNRPTETLHETRKRPLPGDAADRRPSRRGGEFSRGPEAGARDPGGHLSAKLQPAREDADRLVVRLLGVDDEDGVLHIGLFNNAESYQSRRGPLRACRSRASDGTCTWHVDDLPPGQYAVAVFQDRNENGQLDKNTFGIPTEPYGFSNQFQGQIRPPSYEQAKFDYRGQTLNVDIRLD